MIRRIQSLWELLTSIVIETYFERETDRHTHTERNRGTERDRQRQTERKRERE